MACCHARSIKRKGKKMTFLNRKGRLWPLVPSSSARLQSGNQPLRIRGSVLQWKKQPPTCPMHGRRAGLVAGTPHMQPAAGQLLPGSQSQHGRAITPLSPNSQSSAASANSKVSFCLSVESCLEASGHVENPQGNWVNSVSAPYTSGDSFPTAAKYWEQRPQTNPKIKSIS